MVIDGTCTLAQPEDCYKTNKNKAKDKQKPIPEPQSATTVIDAFFAVVLKTDASLFINRTPLKNCFFAHRLTKVKSCYFKDQ